MPRNYWQRHKSDPVFRQKERVRRLVKVAIRSGVLKVPDWRPDGPGLESEGR